MTKYTWRDYLKAGLGLVAAIVTVSALALVFDELGLLDPI